MSSFSFRHPITGAGLGTLLMLSSLMTILYLDYRGAVNPDEMGIWISVCALGSLGLGVALMMLLRSVLFHRWQDDKRAVKAVRRIDLIILLVTLLLGCVLTVILIHRMQ